MGGATELDGLEDRLGRDVSGFTGCKARGGGVESDEGSTAVRGGSSLGGTIAGEFPSRRGNKEGEDPSRSTPRSEDCEKEEGDDSTEVAITLPFPFNAFSPRSIYHQNAFTKNVQKNNSSYPFRCGE